MSRKILMVSCLLLGVAVFDVRPAAAQVRKVHLVMIGAELDEITPPGNQGIGQGVGVSARRIKGLFERTFSTPGALSITTVGFTSPDLTLRNNNPDAIYTLLNANNIATAVSNLNGGAVVGADDVVYCHVMVHGAYDPNKAAVDNDRQRRGLPPTFDYGHWFQLNGKDPRFSPPFFESYPRVNLMEQLVRLNARLTVLLTDSCNDELEIPAVARAATAAVVPPRNVLVSLLMESQGQVDISATDFGQKAVYWTDIGGVFTHEFIQLAESNDNSIRTWPAFFPRLQSATTNSPTLRGEASYTPKLMRNLDQNQLRPYAPAGPGPAGGAGAPPQPPTENAPAPQPTEEAPQPSEEKKGPEEKKD